MWLSLKRIVLVPFPLLMIGFGIVTHKKSLLEVKFPSVYEGTALLFVIVIRSHDDLELLQPSWVTEEKVSWEWFSTQNCLKLNCRSPVLSPVPIFHSIFPVAKARIFGAIPNFTLSRPTFCSLEDPMSSSFKLHLHLLLVPPYTIAILVHATLSCLRYCNRAVPTQGILVGLN